MPRPHIICHMVTSIDGKVTGDFLNQKTCENATEIYYEINREYRKNGALGFICGRITMEQSFTNGYYPDLSNYDDTTHHSIWLDSATSDFYAIAFDPRGKLGWKSAIIEDSDIGYDKSQVIEVLTEQVDRRYLSYLHEMGIPYLIAGKDEIDVALALDILGTHLKADILLLEGGSIINGHFLRAGCVDEISIVQAPIIADKSAKPLFENGKISDFSLTSVEQKNDVVVLKYTHNI